MARSTKVTRVVATLRAKYPSFGQRSFARQIKTNDFAYPENREQAAKLATVSEATIYSAIRRFDAALKVV